VSRRQIERMFHRHLIVHASRYYLRLEMEKALSFAQAVKICLIVEIFNGVWVYFYAHTLGRCFYRKHLAFRLFVERTKNRLGKRSGLMHLSIEKVRFIHTHLPKDAFSHSSH